MFTTRPAKLNDYEAIAKLIELEAKRDNMLPRSRGEIMVNLTNFLVAESEGEIIGCCGLKIWVNEEAEIISLTTREEYRSRGVGNALLSIYF